MSQAQLASQAYRLAHIVAQIDPTLLSIIRSFFCVLFRLTRLVRLRMNHSLAFLLVYDKAKIDDSLLNRDEAQLECSTMNRVSTYAVIVRAELLSELIAILPTPLAF